MKNSTKKLVIVINGRSGVGKDTLIGFAAKKYKVLNVSSIDRVKEIALFAGWDGIKDERGRKLLIDMKAALVSYDDLPTKYMADAAADFMKSGGQIMFVHIREAAEIRKFCAAVPCKTLLVTREAAEKFNLNQDDALADFKYDYTFENDKPIEESGADFVELIKKIRGKLL